MTDNPARHFSIETPRLLLRPLAMSDARTITALANNWKVVRHLSLLPFPYEEHHATEFLSRITLEPVTTTFAIGDARNAGELLGIIGAGAPADHRAGNFGYWLGEPHWGKGYATEAARAVVRLCFERLAVTEVLSACRPENPASRHVLEKCGFVYAGKGTMPSEALGKETEIELFTLTRDDWINAGGSGCAVTIHEDTGCTGAQTG